MDIRKLQRAIVDGLEDVKGQDICVFNTEHLSALFERVIVASGLSNRQAKALAAGVRDKVREKGFRVFSTEGEDNGEWIIVDCGAAVVHIMQPEIREYYHLEEIWGEKPVRMKLLSRPTGLAKASEPMDEPVADEPPARRPAAKVAKSAKPAKPTKPAKPRSSTPASAAARPAAAAKPGRKTAPTRVSASGGTARAPGRSAASKSTGPARKSADQAAKGKPAAARAAGRAGAARPARPPASRGAGTRTGAAKTSRRSS